MKKVIVSKSYSELQKALDEIVAWFDSDEFEVEKAAEQFEAASLLIAEIKQRLTTLNNSVEKLKLKNSD